MLVRMLIDTVRKWRRERKFHKVAHEVTTEGTIAGIAEYLSACVLSHSVCPKTALVTFCFWEVTGALHKLGVHKKVIMGVIRVFRVKSS